MQVVRIDAAPERRVTILGWCDDYPDAQPGAFVRVTEPPPLSPDDPQTSVRTGAFRVVVIREGMDSWIALEAVDDSPPLSWLPGFRPASALPVR
jgi:hypothetical protein